MRWLALLVATSLCTGCVHPVELNGAPQPSASTADRSSEKAGVVCSAELLGHVERAHPSTLVGLATTYQFALGQPLCNALFKSVESSYRAALRASTPYYKGQYGRVVQFDLQNSSLAIVPQPNGSTRVTYTVSVIVERYGRDLQLQSRNVVTGNSLVDCRKLTDEVVQQVVEAALQEVADDATSLLVARIDGPRVPAAPER